MSQCSIKVEHFYASLFEDFATDLWGGENPFSFVNQALEEHIVVYGTFSAENVL